MGYQFPDDVASRLQAFMATGRYSSEDDVLRVALDSLAGSDADLEAINKGWADVQAGRYRRLEDVDLEMRTKHGIPRGA